MKKYLNHEQAAEYLGVSKSALYTWKCQGLLAAKKHGRLNFYEVEVLDNLGKQVMSLNLTPKVGVYKNMPVYQAGSLTSKYKEIGHPIKELG